ncbi:hypothetical protein ACHAWC_007212 [Mediolabrus comicus]
MRFLLASLVGLSVTPSSVGYGWSRECGSAEQTYCCQLYGSGHYGQAKDYCQYYNCDSNKCHPTKPTSSWGSSGRAWSSPKPTKPPSNGWETSWWGGGNNNNVDWVWNGWGSDVWGANDAWTGDGWNGKSKLPTKTPTSSPVLPPTLPPTPEEAHSLTGIYIGIDTEDATGQQLNIVCDDDDEDKDEVSLCNITLRDSRFSACDLLVPYSSDHGVGIAKDIPKDSIGNFQFELYCLKPGETEIDFNSDPTTTLPGDIEILPDGSLRRTGPDFFYAKVSLPEIKDENGDEVPDIDDEKFNPNGSYRGLDLRDGSVQFMDLDCTRSECDILLSDSSWTSCKALLGQSFYQGVGIAKGVPRGSLSNFDIELYCLEDDVRFVNYTREPDTILPGNLILDRDGILKRTGLDTETTYIKIGPNEVEEPFSVYEDFALSLVGLDTEDASQQFLTIDCKRGFCDIELADTSFSTCIDAIPGDIYLAGLAIATDVPQDSLDNFTLPLYCATNVSEPIGFGIDIDYTAPAAILKGNFVFRQPGIIERTGPGFKYFSDFKGAGGDRALTTTGSRFYQGFRYDNGGSKLLFTSCQHKKCEVIIYSVIEPACIIPSGGRPFLNGVAVSSNVSEDSLDNFEIGLYCVPAGPGAKIDYNTQQPISTIKVSITPSDQRGTIRLGEDDNKEIQLFKISAGE